MLEEHACLCSQLDDVPLEADVENCSSSVRLLKACKMTVRHVWLWQSRWEPTSLAAGPAPLKETVQLVCVTQRPSLRCDDAVTHAGSLRRA